MRRTTSRVIAFAIVLAVVSGRSASAQIVIVDLGTLPGSTFSTASDINDRGQIVG